VTGPGNTVSWDPDYTEQVGYETELVVVIGEEARRVDRDVAMDHVAGFTVENDGSARDLQHGDGQWVRGKSPDSFAPTGQELVTSDAVDPHSPGIRAEVNGERLQESNTDQFIFGIDELVVFCSGRSRSTPATCSLPGRPSASASTANRRSCWRRGTR
jgi:2-keto-4-pentenoate hydratase/2-oxohepta-3-ene-1,7-dioic acid hydratase in catechol pathway